MALTGLRTALSARVPLVYTSAAPSIDAMFLPTISLTVPDGVTVTVYVIILPDARARTVIRHWPSATGVIRPLASTLAIFSSLEAKRIVSPFNFQSLSEYFLSYDHPVLP